MKIINKAAELKKYTDRYPESMVITMLDLARYMELYGCRPDIVSKGKQKLLQRFAEEIKASWEKGDTQYNEFYFKRVVALAIIYKRTDEIIKQSEWYRENRSYKANVIAYTMSIIFNHCHIFLWTLFSDYYRWEVSPLLCRYHTVLWNFVSDIPFLYNCSVWQ